MREELCDSLREIGCVVLGYTFVYGTQYLGESIAEFAGLTGVLRPFPAVAILVWFLRGMFRGDN